MVRLVRQKTNSSKMCSSLSPCPTTLLKDRSKFYHLCLGPELGVVRLRSRIRDMIPRS